jgi:hypothetical protein
MRAHPGSIVSKALVPALLPYGVTRDQMAADRARYSVAALSHRRFSTAWSAWSEWPPPWGDRSLNRRLHRRGGGHQREPSHWPE